MVPSGGSAGFIPDVKTSIAAGGDEAGAGQEAEAFVFDFAWAGVPDHGAGGEVDLFDHGMRVSASDEDGGFVGSEDGAEGPGAVGTEGGLVVETSLVVLPQSARVRPRNR